MTKFIFWRTDPMFPGVEPSQIEPVLSERLTWYNPDNPALSLETEEGKYNFAAVEDALKRAGELGAKLALRLRFSRAQEDTQIYVPPYLAKCGTVNTTGAWVADMNSKILRQSWFDMLDHFAGEYGSRLAWYEIGFGWHGENKGIPDGVSDETMSHWIKPHLALFPNTQLLFMAKTRPSLVAYALSLSNQIGWRVDGMGKRGYFDFAYNPNWATAWPVMRDRWATAPVVAELGGADIDGPTAYAQAREFNAWYVGAGNVGPFEKLPKETQFWLGRIACAV